MHKRRYLGWIGALVLGAACVMTMSSAIASDAATYYVATTGSDSYAGTAAQPLRTMRKGATKLRAGDTLIVNAGTYQENLADVFPSGTSWSQPVTVRAAQGATVNLKPASKTDVVVSFSGTNTKYVILDGFVIDGNNLASFGVYISEGAEHIRVTNCEVKNTRYSGILVSPGQAPGTKWGCCNEFINLDVHNNGLSVTNSHGIYVATTSNLIERSRFYHNGGYGVQVYHSYGGVNNNIVRYSEVYDNNVLGNAAGMVLASGTNNTAYNNLIWNNKSGLLISSPGSKVYHNTIYNNKKAGGDGHGILIQNNASGVTIKNNILYRNNTTAIYGLSSQVTHSNNLLNTDPRFVAESSHDFRLRAGSPAIDTGVVLSEVRDDIDGVARPYGSKSDIGAYEYTTSSVPSQLPAPRNLRVVSQP